MIDSNNPDLDDLDRKIVDVLQHEGRLSVPALAERVGTSRATAYSRFDRLVEGGVIIGFGANVDPVKLGLNVAALAMVRIRQVRWRTAADSLASVDGVEWLALSAGSSDFVLLLRAESLEHLRDVVLEQVLAVDGVEGIETRVLLEELRPRSPR